MTALIRFRSRPLTEQVSVTCESGRRGRIEEEREISGISSQHVLILIVAKI